MTHYIPYYYYLKVTFHVSHLALMGRAEVKSYILGQKMVGTILLPEIRKFIQKTQVFCLLLYFMVSFFILYFLSVVVIPQEQDGPLTIIWF
jgi:hypothetical protein